MKLKYVGTSHYREITAADFNSIGFPDEGKVIFDRDNRGGDNVHTGKSSLAQVHEFPEPVGKWLMENMPGEFAVVKDEPEDAPETIEGGPDLQTFLDGGTDESPTGMTTASGRRRAVRDNPQA